MLITLQQLKIVKIKKMSIVESPIKSVRQTSPTKRSLENNELIVINRGCVNKI